MADIDPTYSNGVPRAVKLTLELEGSFQPITNVFTVQTFQTLLEDQPMVAGLLGDMLQRSNSSPAPGSPS